MKKKILLFLYFVSFQLLFVVSIFGQTLEMPQGFRVQIYAEIHSARSDGFLADFLMKNEKYDFCRNFHQKATEN